jgi:arylsulfatase A-like enzyme
VESPDDPNYHFSEDMTSKIIAYIREQKAMTPDKPFFVYVSFGAVHAPFHVPKPYMEKYRGKFDQGWDKQREETFARQKQLGVIPQDAQLTERPSEIAAWDSLSADEKRVAARLMEAYAGFADHTDVQVGRIVDTLQDMGALDNTLFLYILGDNGASAEGGPNGALNEIAALNGIVQSAAEILPHLDEIGGPMTYCHYPVGWAHAMDTPYQWTKQVASHWGGTRNGMIVHWPAGIKAKGEIRNQWCHVIDIVPTILELAKLPTRNSWTASSSSQSRAAASPTRSRTRRPPSVTRRNILKCSPIAASITRDGRPAPSTAPWLFLAKLPKFDDDVWELYAPDDWTQANNIAAQNPAKLKELQQLFLLEGAKYQVFPLDDRRVERLNSDMAGRPDPVAGRTTMTLYAGMSHINENTVLNVKNKSHAVTAEITVPDNKTTGVIVAQGGRFGGWCLYLKGGVPAYCYNFFGFNHTYARGCPAPRARQAHAAL